jgi:NADH-quinone oxidoreductase subunit M
MGNLTGLLFAGGLGFMLLALASGDLLSLFIGWELVSWAGFLLMALAGGIATKAAIRYIIYAMSGGMAIFGGIALVYSASGSLQLEAVITAVEQISTTKLWLLVILFGGGFGVKMGLLPFHLWQAPAYAETPGPASAFLGAISSRIGLFAILLVLVKLFGIVNIDSLKVPFSLIDARDLLAWIAVFTIIFPTYTAMNVCRYLPNRRHTPLPGVRPHLYPRGDRQLFHSAGRDRHSR